MDRKTLAPKHVILSAIIFVSVAITATAIGMTRKEERPAARPTPVLDQAADPLRDGQRRCQQMGDAAARDSECLRIWVETRDRFLKGSAAPRRTDEGR